MRLHDALAFSLPGCSLYQMPIHPSSSNDRWSFDGFSVSAADRRLERDGEVLSIGSRAFDILTELLRHPGEIVPKQRLMNVVWPDTHVVEGNLTVHISQLRRILGGDTAGHDYIVTVPGRGYQFVSAAATQPSAIRQDNLVPTRSIEAPRVYGRDEDLAAVASLLATRRLVSLLGAPGIGKTTLAEAILERAASDPAIHTAFVDLAPLSDPLLVAGAVAAALGADLNDPDSLAAISRALAGATTLIVLDNCEHLVAAAASLAHDVLRQNSEVQILATSREALGIRGEQRYQLAPLALPAGDCPSVDDLQLSPATRLFLERARDNDSHFVARPDEAPLIAAICGRLDGIPLAIEIAASQVEILGVAGVHASLADRLILPPSRDRFVSDRHRSIAAAVDWSFLQTSKHFSLASPASSAGSRARLLPDWTRNCPRLPSPSIWRSSSRNRW